MCCVVALFAWISPRFALFMAWLFANDRMSAAFDSFWIALLGFFILPWTTLAWAIEQVTENSCSYDHVVTRLGLT